MANNGPTTIVDVKDYVRLNEVVRMGNIPRIGSGHWRIRNMTIIADGQSVIHAYGTAVVYGYGDSVIVHCYDDAKAYMSSQQEHHGKNYSWERDRTKPIFPPDIIKNISNSKKKAFIDNQYDFLFPKKKINDNSYDFLFQFPKKEIKYFDLQLSELITLCQEVTTKGTREKLLITLGGGRQNTGDYTDTQLTKEDWFAMLTETKNEELKNKLLRCVLDNNIQGSGIQQKVK